MLFELKNGKTANVNMNFQCLLFDLDGTLVNSRADLSTSVNLALAEMGLATLPEEPVMQYVGEGIRVLIERSLAASLGSRPEEQRVDLAIEIYRRHYGAHLLDTTRPYPEVKATLEHFSSLPKAVVTNKPYGFTIDLLKGLGLETHFAAILGGDSLAERKPSPAPLLEAARRCDRKAQDCLMIGDSRIDIEAGAAAGMDTCGFVSGFRGRLELEKAGADFLIERFSELIAIVDVPGK